MKTHAACISRKATSLALKCSVSKELLVQLEKAIDNLDLEVDNSLSKVQEKTDEGKYENTCCTYLTKGDIPCTEVLSVKTTSCSLGESRR